MENIFRKLKANDSLIMAFLLSYWELLSLVTFLQVHSNPNSKEVPYRYWQNRQPNLKTTCLIKLNFLLWTKLLKGLLVAKCLIYIAATLNSFRDGHKVWQIFLKKKCWILLLKNFSFGGAAMIIWQHWEEKLLEFLKMLNNCHLTKKFTLQYSWDKVNFFKVEVRSCRKNVLQNFVKTYRYSPVLRIFIFSRISF